MSHDTALNADYYGAMLRSCYSGQETWLNTVSGNGSPYRAHDLWGSVGFWSAGHWHVSVGTVYVAKVKTLPQPAGVARPMVLDLGVVGISLGELGLMALGHVLSVAELIA